MVHRYYWNFFWRRSKSAISRVWFLNALDVIRKWISLEKCISFEYLCNSFASGFWSEFLYSVEFISAIRHLRYNCRFCLWVQNWPWGNLWERYDVCGDFVLLVFLVLLIWLVLSVWFLLLVWLAMLVWLVPQVWLLLMWLARLVWLILLVWLALLVWLVLRICLVPRICWQIPDWRLRNATVRLLIVTVRE